MRRVPQRRDANEASIVAAFKALGWSVQKMSARGCPDLLCGKGRLLILVEVKAKAGKLTDDQRKWFSAWCGPLPVIVRSVEHAVEIATALERKATAEA